MNDTQAAAEAYLRSIDMTGVFNVVTADGTTVATVVVND